MIWTVCISLEFFFLYWVVVREALRYGQCRSCAEIDDDDDTIERDGDYQGVTLAKEACLGTYMGCLALLQFVKIFVSETPLSSSTYYLLASLVLMPGMIVISGMDSLTSIYARRSAKSLAMAGHELRVV